MKKTTASAPRDGEEQGVHERSDEGLATGLERPLQRRIIDDKGPGEMGLGGRTDVEVVRRGGVGRQAVKNAVVVDVSIVVVVVGKDVELQVRGPGCHDLELPLAVAAALRHLRVDTLVVAPLVEGTTGDELRNTASCVISTVRVNDDGRRLRDIAPVYKRGSIARHN